MGKLKKAAAEIMFRLHFALAAAWLGLFLVPASLWSGKAAFHFGLILIAVAAQLGRGIILMPITGKYGMACPLTTATQMLRRYKISDEKNNNRSCIKEFFERAGWKIPKNAVTISTLASLALVTPQYFSAAQ